MLLTKLGKFNLFEWVDLFRFLVCLGFSWLPLFSSFVDLFFAESFLQPFSYLLLLGSDVGDSFLKKELPYISVGG